MEKQTILKTTAAGLCTGCGICAGVCPKSCIGWELREGICQPRIDEAACVSCGLCAKLCPGLGHPYEDQGDPVQTVTGPVLACCNAWSRDAQIRHISASGGVVTTLVKTLLDSAAMTVSSVWTPMITGSSSGSAVIPPTAFSPVMSGA